MPSLAKTATNFLSSYILFPNMKQPLVSQFANEKITIPNPSTFYTKFANIRMCPKQLEFISDFDYTITKYRHDNRQCDSLFGMWVRKIGSGEGVLPSNFRNQLIKNYNEFGPFETDATISFEDRVQLVGELYRIQTKAFEKYQITQEMAEQVLNNSYLVYRSHTTELLQCLEDNNIPLYIISGGISDAIYNSLFALNRKNFRNISIHSNELQPYTLSLPDEEASFLEPMKYIKFRKNIIHSYNKYKVMNHVNKRKNCFLMGDLVSDIYMAEGNGYENVLSVFYAKQGENDQRAHAQRKFDIIVEGDSSHRVIIELVKAINGMNVDWEYVYSTGSNLHELLI